MNNFESLNILNNLIDVVVIADQERKITYKSPNVEKSFGWKPQELIGKDMFMYIHPEDLTRVEKLFQILTGNPNATVEVECRYRCKDNSYKWIHYKGINLLHDENINGLLGSYQDITVRRNAEMELVRAKERAEESEQRLKALQNASFGGIAMHEKGKILDCNKSLCNITGYKYDELIGMDGMLLIAESSREMVMSKIMIGYERPYEVVGLRKNGEEYPVRIEARNIPYKGRQIRSTEFRDITEIKNVEAEIINAKEKAEENEFFLKESQRTGNIGSYKMDMVSGYWISTEILDSIFGIDDSYEKNVEGWLEVVHPEDRNMMGDYLRSEVIGNKKTFDKEYRIIRRNDHAIRWLHGMGRLYFNEKGNLIAMLGTIQDITEQKKYEEQILEKNAEYESLNEELRKMNEELFIAKEKSEEANRLKTEFLNNMSHEIRTPMNGIVGFAEMLDEPGISDEKRKYFSKIVQNSSHQLLRIIDDILEIARIETSQQKLKEETFCLNDLLMELFSIYNLKSKERNIPIYIKKALDDNQCYIISDKAKLNRIIGNLIENALKFTLQGFIEVGYFIKEHKLTIYVKDTGKGISPENFNLIFERFSQEEKDISELHGGLGLGLSISRENARLIGGEITLESEKGKGSTFYVTIPYKTASNRSDINAGLSSKIAKDKDEANILVVEDEEVNYLYIDAVLTKKNDIKCHLIHAKNGKEAVNICTDKGNIDLVLMDIKMPVLNGFEATKQIKSVFPELPVIAQTAYSTEQEKEIALNSGCDDFISKPLEKERLYELIQKFLIKSKQY